MIHKGAHVVDYAWLVIPWLLMLGFVMYGCATINKWDAELKARNERRREWCHERLFHTVVKQPIGGEANDCSPRTAPCHKTEHPLFYVWWCCPLGEKDFSSCIEIPNDPGEVVL